MASHAIVAVPVCSHDCKIFIKIKYNAIYAVI